MSLQEDEPIAHPLGLSRLICTIKSLRPLCCATVYESATKEKDRAIRPTASGLCERQWYSLTNWCIVIQTKKET
jgi:hypothetical protein